ncbi:MAG: hypothetical protein IT435_16105 [Phycisphaerales bacterium]|nr:hypothetical protein [Phycisphaerales bacterium]
MGTPSVQVRLATRFVGADPITPVDGVDGFYGLVPVAEPISAGEPPHEPDLLDNFGYEIPRRDARSVSNHLAGALLDTAKRPKLTVRWTARAKAVRDDVLSFLDTECRNGELAFDYRPDGPGTAVIKVRATSPARDSRIGKGAYTIEVETEEVW